MYFFAFLSFLEDHSIVVVISMLSELSVIPRCTYFCLDTLVGGRISVRNAKK